MLDPSDWPDSYAVDTSNVLFILSGAFVGLENIVRRCVTKGVCLSSDLSMQQSLIIPSQSIGFTANLSAPDEATSSSDMPFFTPNNSSSNLLTQVEPQGIDTALFCYEMAPKQHFWLIPTVEL